jgi:hypothetical protein
MLECGVRSPTHGLSFSTSGQESLLTISVNEVLAPRLQSTHKIGQDDGGGGDVSGIYGGQRYLRIRKSL